jgi:medium-chain acyl-[acyl-carrier-protein] hydrolase
MRNSSIYHSDLNCRSWDDSIPRETNVISKVAAWIRRPKVNPRARLRLFCFPFSGGAASFYNTWMSDLPWEIELCPVQLPGRGGRFRETPYTDMSPLVYSLSGIIRLYSDVPFAFFGHSVGALIGFELARELRKRDGLGPVHLFVSGRRAPHIPHRGPFKHKMPGSELIQTLRQYNGTPELVLKEPDLMEIFLPILRSDFSVGETYTYGDDRSLDCPITAFGGSNDEETSHDDLMAWGEHTNADFRIKVFSGEHFYLKRAQAQLLHEITVDLKKCLMQD